MSILLICISGSYAETFKKGNTVGIIIQEESLKITSKDYTTKYLDFTVEKIDSLNYKIHWQWNNQEVKNALINCFKQSGNAQKDCANSIKANYFPEISKDMKNDIKKLDTVSLKSDSSSCIKFKKTSFDATADEGILEIEIKGTKKKKDKGKIGFETTTIELTDVDVEITIDPETENCQDGLCKHNIDIVNSTDSNFCFNSLDIYGTFDPNVTNQQMYFYKNYADENGEWQAWEKLTTQECIKPNETGNLKYFYEVPLFTSGKWDFHFWYNGTDNEIYPYYNNNSWAFTQPTNYNYGSLITVDGNAFLLGVGEDYAHWNLNESSGTNVPDTSGNARHCTTVNMEDADWVSGKLNNNLQFDGTDEYVNCSNIANFERTDEFSLESWVKSTTIGSNMIISKIRKLPVWRGWWLNFIDGKINFGLDYQNPDVLMVETIDSSFADGNYHHVVATYDGTSLASGVHIYVDGVDKPLTILNNSLTGTIQTSVNLQIGSYQNSTDFFNGSIDEVVIYEEELSLPEVSFRYNTGVGIETPLNATYSTANPTITARYSLTDTNRITQLTNFIETATKPVGTEIKYQLTDDNGSTYQWWNGAIWTSASDTYSQANTVSDINSNITTFSVGSPREVKFRAYLHTDSNIVSPTLDEIEIEYEYSFGNNPPNNFNLTPEPDQNNVSTVNLDWDNTTDPESDAFHFNIRVGTTSGANNILDTNTTNSYHNNLSVSATNTYYWKVIACEDANHTNCSDWTAEDSFLISTSCTGGNGVVCITATVGNEPPTITNTNLIPQFWNGVGEIWFMFDCIDADMNYAYAIITGANTHTLPNFNLTIDDNASLEISSYLTQQGDYTIYAKCVDAIGQITTATGTEGHYSPDYNILINDGDTITNSLTVNLTMDAPMPTQYMAFSCDTSNWSSWEIYNTTKTDFDMGGQPTIGCTAYGEGHYFVYVAYSDGNNVYTNYDSIYAEGADINAMMYESPEEATTPTMLVSLFDFDNLPIALIVLIALIILVLWWTVFRKRGYNNGY